MSRGDILVGATITAARPMTKEEARGLGWSPTPFETPVVLEVTTKQGEALRLYPMRDPEGNGPGALLIAAGGALFTLYPE